MIDMKGIRALSQAIAQEFRPECIILFGSYAYGTPTEDSDVDLLVVLSFAGKPVRKALEIFDRVQPALPLDLLVRTPEQVRERLANNDWFLSEVFSRGQKLYESDHAGVGS